MNFPWIYPVRAAQAVFAIIVLGLAGHVASLFNADLFSSSRVDFMIFVSVWTFFIVVPALVVVPLKFPSYAIPWAIVAVDAITMIFWLAGFAALADGISSLTDFGVCSRYGWCQELQAATAFGAFNWVLFVASTVYGVLAALKRNQSSEPQNPPTTSVP